LQLYQDLLADFPNDGHRQLWRLRRAISFNNLAWLLATTPGYKSEDHASAVELAMKAVELAPKARTHWNTLGVAYYCAGDWKGSLTALAKSMELSKGGDSFDWFFLAMAHWQLGQKEEARKWYEQAVQWMEKNSPQDEELLRFRAEAAKLLGVPDQLKAKAVTAGKDQKNVQR
jgi:tetratricopeptide (TPR) repeat protein